MSEAQVESLSCPNCGAPLIVRSMGHAVSIVCEHCSAILDARSPQLTILHRYAAATERDIPLIPLGSRGKWRGTDYEVIGYQRREMQVEGITYAWHEYLLFNPYKGFRYFTEYNGHWNDASAVKGLPEQVASTATYLGRTYKRFQSCTASTAFVLGEFPWQVSLRDRVRVEDYVSPPFLLSSETSDNETTWTLGEYVNGAEIWKAFGLQDSPPARIGVFENQPSQWSLSSSQVWFTCLGLVAALSVIFMWNQFSAQRARVFHDSYQFSVSNTDPSFVTPEFELKGRTSSVEVHTEADVSNQWLYLGYALINEDSGEAYDFGREVSYYFGRDSDGSWTEGSQNDNVTLPSIPPGRYYLRIEPESDASFAPISYSVTVTRDVPVLSIYLAALAALFVPALFVSWRAHNFEHLRWAESDAGEPTSPPSKTLQVILWGIFFVLFCVLCTYIEVKFGL